MSTTIARCQAANPATCTDPMCPEKRGIRAAYQTATENKDYNAFEAAKKAEARSGAPKPTAPKPLPPVSRPQPAGNRGPQGEEILFHTEVFLPPTFKAPTGTVRLEYSGHAKSEAAKDRYGDIPILSKLNLDHCKVIELGVRDGKLSKILYRTELDEGRDLCIVVIPKPNGQPWFVKTVWINENNDGHKTLDRRKYFQPKKTA